MADQTLRLRGFTEWPEWIETPVHRQVSSDDLMAGERVIIIQHGADEYRLRVTAAGKLILTR
ncbi:MAG: hemin uptake protein HemP [Acetobacteraceae bacterium]